MLFLGPLWIGTRQLNVRHLQERCYRNHFYKGACCGGLSSWRGSRKNGGKSSSESSSDLCFHCGLSKENNLFVKLLNTLSVSLFLVSDLFRLVKYLTMTASIFRKTWTRGSDILTQQKRLHDVVLSLYRDLAQIPHTPEKIIRHC